MNTQYFQPLGIDFYFPFGIPEIQVGARKLLQEVLQTQEVSEFFTLSQYVNHFLTSTKQILFRHHGSDGTSNSVDKFLSTRYDDKYDFIQGKIAGEINSKNLRSVKGFYTRLLNSFIKLVDSFEKQ